MIKKSIKKIVGSEKKVSKNNWMEIPAKTLFKRYNDFLKELWRIGFSLSVVKGYRNVKSGREKIIVGKRKFYCKKRGNKNDKF